MIRLKWQQVAAILSAVVIMGGAITYPDLIGALFRLKGVSYTHSGDIECGTTCESYINVSTWYWRICFAHYNETKYENETLFKKVSRSRTLHVNMANVENIITTDPRVEVDWMVPARGAGNWRDIKDGDCWERGKINKIKLVGHKEKTQTVKWSLDVEDYINIDPKWMGRDDGNIIDRTYSSDTYSLGNNQFKTRYYMGTVNVPYMDEFIPVEEFINVSVKDDDILIKDLYGNKCTLSLNYTKTNALSISNTKVNIIKNRGSYYFTTDIGTDVDYMAYSIGCGFKFEDYKLKFNNIIVDFNQAKEEQGIEVEHKYDIVFNKEMEEEHVNHRLEFTAIDGNKSKLKFIDPTVTYDYSDEINILALESSSGSLGDPPSDGPFTTDCSWTDITSSAALDTSDDSDEITNAHGPGFPGQMFIVDIQVPSIILLNWTYEGDDASGSAANLLGYWWNDSSSVWLDVGRLSNVDSGDKVTYIEQNGQSLSDFINASGHTTLIVMEDNSLWAGQVATDFVKLEVTYLNNYTLNITKPLSENPVSVSHGDDFITCFNLSDWGTEITSGVHLDNITVGGVPANTTNFTVSAGTWYSRSDRDGNTGVANPNTVSFMNLPDTSYAVLVQSNSTTSDTVYSTAWLNKAVGSFQVKIEDDGGNAESVPFSWAAIPIGEYSLGNNLNIKCGYQALGASTGTVTFDTAFPNSSYSVILNPTDDGDAPACGIDTPDASGDKPIGSFYIECTDDAGSGETVTGVDYCAFTRGHYDYGGITYKSGADTIGPLGLFVVNFTTPFPDSNYVVFISHVDQSILDVCQCELIMQTESWVRFTCVDDAGVAGGDCNNDEFDWVAFTSDDYNSTLTSDSMLSHNGSCYQINVTAPEFAGGTQDLFLNVTYSSTSTDITEPNSVDYGGVSDTCSPTKDTDHTFDCSDDCILSTDIILGNVEFVGCGSIYVNADIYVKNITRKVCCDYYYMNNKRWIPRT